MTNLKLRWSAAGLVERIREWLRLTSRGELHETDQPLEPLLAGVEWTILLPANFREQFEGLEIARLRGMKLKDSPKPFLSFVPNSADSGKTAGHVGTLFIGKPVEHGIITHHPKNLVELDAFCRRAGLELFSELGRRIRESHISKEQGDILGSKLVLILDVPKQRKRGGPVEMRETWVFCVDASIKDLCVATGVMGNAGGQTAVIISGEASTPDAGKLSKIAVYPMQPVFTQNREACARSNGLAAESVKIALIGAGALGSQIFNNLFRAGLGAWTIIDKDILLPHKRNRGRIAWLD